MFGAQRDRGRRARHRRRGRHGIDEQRALPAAEGARGLPPGARAGDRLDDQRRPVGRVQEPCTWATAPSCARRRRGSRAPTRTRSRPSRTAARCAPHAEGKFKREIVPVEIAQRKGPPTVVADDEEPGRGDVAKLGALRPAFQKDGTVTAGNASSINDGAAALVLAGADTVAARGWKPIARIVAVGGHAQAPEWFTTAPAGAIERALQARGLEDGRRRSLGDQRGVRGRLDREQQAAGAGSGARERVGRRGRAGTPDRRVGRARAGDVAFGA